MTEKVTLGAGCFWCIEACFQTIRGVTSVLPGYSGGTKATADYNLVKTGRTNHAEVAQIEFDSSIISFADILKVFWFVHDPTQLNRQGNDVGKQYRSVIFYHSETQKNIANEQKQQLTKENVWENPIVTEIVPLETFYPAEDYHHNYLENNPENQYCQMVVRPKVEKFKQAFRSIVVE